LAHALSEHSGTSGNGRWSDFVTRFTSAAILGPVALFCIWHGGLAWMLFLAAACFGLALEWARLAGLTAQKFGAWALVFGLVCPFFLARSGLDYSFMVMAATALLMGANFGWFAAAGIPYAGIGGLALLWLRLQPGIGLTDTLFLVATVWGTDIGAYAVGRMLGGPKMAPKISPGKTWSGSVGGFCAGGLMAAWLAGGFHAIDWAALPAGCLLSVFAQAGDLLESAIKRKLGVKDSGRTIPGHGGLFDRLDGFLMAAPVAALLALGAHGGLPLWG
jgi:phosphatidate cytidylyltransferase